jgi:hypothetical protein
MAAWEAEALLTFEEIMLAGHSAPNRNLHRVCDTLFLAATPFPTQVR